VIGRTPRLHREPHELLQAIFDLLRSMYPNHGGISGLLPDLLGERLVALALDQDDELLDVCVGPLASSETARRSLTLLTRLAQRFPEEGRWLAETLRRHLPARRREARLVAVEAGGPMAAILMEVLTTFLKDRSRAGFRMVMDELWQNVPRDSLYLQDFAINVAEQRVVIVDDKSSGGPKQAMQRFVGHSELGELFSKSGRLSESADQYRLAYQHAQTLAKGKTPAALQRLASVGSQLASALRRIGRFEEALERAQEAEELRRELAARQPDAHHRADWARSLGNLAGQLRSLGRFEEALEKARQAEELSRELAARQPDAYRAGWARSLGNLATQLSDLGWFEEALEKAQQAEGLFRELAARQPDAYRADWARSLGNLATHLTDLCRFEEALEKAQQAEELFRELAARQPDAYRHDWATALGNLATQLSHLGRFEEALERARQAEEVFRELVARQPDAYRADWATSLRNLGTRLRNLGRFEEALERAQEAEELFREGRVPGRGVGVGRPGAP
jgi:tetratricopeptide (TPR) repeat protein